ncbi:MAG: hypothetical protein WD876_01350, partial [Candidatus Pacearchaeota archaeon]
MKKILIQDKSSNFFTLDAVRGSVQDDFKGIFEIETTRCLSRTVFDITKYSLVISHPDVYEGCCTPSILRANEMGVPMVFTYQMMNPDKELRAVSERFKIELKQRFLGYEFYRDLIKRLEDKI